MSIQYSRDQVYDLLIKQGYAPERAATMSQMLGDIPEQDSNILPNIGEGTAAALALAAMGKAKPLAADADMLAKVGSKAAGIGRFAGAGLAGSLGYMGLSALTGNNYADQASMGQLAADAGAGIGGYVLGERLGKGAAAGLGDLANTKLRKTALGGATAKGLAKVIGGRAAARLFGGTVGGLLGPGGAILGSTLASYLAPKLFDSEAENMLEPDKGLDPGTMAALTAAGVVASPIGRPVRKLLGDNSLTNWAKGTDAAKWIDTKAQPYVKQASDLRAKYLDPLGQMAMSQTPIRAARQGYQGALKNKQQLLADQYAAKNIGVMGDTKNMGPFQEMIDPNSFKGTAYNAKEAWNRLSSLGDGAEDLGIALANMYKKRKQA